MKKNMVSYYIERNEEWIEESIREYFLGKNGLVLKKSNEIAGFSFYQLNEEHIHIDTLQIKPKYQGGMLGWRFFKWYLILAKEYQVKKITCSVYSINPAVDMYKKIGFEVVESLKGVHRLALPLTGQSYARISSARRKLRPLAL